MSDYIKETFAFVNNLCPLVKKAIETGNNLNKFKNAIADFMNANSKVIYDIAPYDIIYYKQRDIDKLFASIGLTEQQIKDTMEDCFYWHIPYKPEAAKEPYVLLCMAAIRYFLSVKKRKEAEVTTVYLAFTGKFYASWFGTFFNTAPPSKNRAVMDYVVNNMLTGKTDLKSYGNLYGAIKKMCCTWLDTYGDKLTGHIDDDGMGKQVQQLRERERSLIANIAKAFFQAYEDKLYLNYETDNLVDGAEFRIADNDALRAARYTENTINYMVSNSVSLQICNKCKDSNIKATEVKDIMETIINNKDNLSDMQRVINILICDFMRNYPGKSIGSVDFVTNSLKMKPNSKDKYIVEMKDIITNWLNENSDNYRRRKSRPATATSYYKAVLMYIVLTISYAAK